ncbi:MAG: substrate-binding domain-containing protein [Thermoguttaceae bacterium]
MKSPVTRSDIPRVALLLETSREVGRGLLRGIDHYIRRHGPWAVHVWPGDLLQHLPDMKVWGGTGIIGRVMYPEVEHAVLKSGLPFVAVDLFEEQKGKQGPFHNASEVYVDTVQVGRMGAEHLLEYGFVHFAFVGEVNNVSWSRFREIGFRDRILAERKDVSCYPTPPKSSRNWGRELHRLGNWLEALPKPVGVMAAMDIRGRQVIEACFHSGLAVPDEVAVLGCDNDQLICSLSDPPMSSIALGVEEGGFQAAAILDKLMRWCSENPNRTLRKSPVYRLPIAPLHVVRRRSTHFRAVTDSLVADALEFIEIHGNSPVTVTQVADRLDISRRTLEMRFKTVLGHSVLEEINRVRLANIRSFLSETTMPIREIAEICGFVSESYLYRFFLRETGQTMNQFRKKKH